MWDDERHRNPYGPPGSPEAADVPAKRSFLLSNLQLSIFVYGVTKTATILGRTVGIGTTVGLYGFCLTCLFFTLSFRAARTCGVLRTLFRMQCAVLVTVFAAMLGAYPVVLDALQKLDSTLRIEGVLISCFWSGLTAACIAGAVLAAQRRTKHV